MHPEIYAEILGLHGCPRDAFSAWGTGVCVCDKMQLQYNEALWYIDAYIYIIYIYIIILNMDPNTSSEGKQPPELYPKYLLRSYGKIHKE